MKDGDCFEGDFIEAESKPGAQGLRVDWVTYQSSWLYVSFFLQILHATKRLSAALQKYSPSEEKAFIWPWKVLETWLVGHMVKRQEPRQENTHKHAPI